MPNLRDDLERVLLELREAQDDQLRLAARIEGLQAQRDALQRAVAATVAVETSPEGEVDISGLTKKQAIVAILAASPSPMTLGEMAEALTTRGNQTTANGVSVYIDELLKANAVTRVSRGHYVAAR